MIGRRSTNVAAAASIALAAVLVTRSARADDASEKREAKHRFDRAVAFVDEGDLERALAEFQRAYKLVPNAHVLLNVAQLQSSLGRSVEASASLDELLAVSKGLVPAELERARSLKIAAEQRVGLVAVGCNVLGASIEVDNIVVASAPISAPIRVSSGTHVFAASAPGYAPRRQTIRVAGQETAQVVFELVPLQARLAHLAIHTALPGATVVVDGDMVALTPLAATLTLAPGTYRVELRRDGYQSASTDVRLGEGANGDVALEPTVDAYALARTSGTIEIRPSELGAEVAIDGNHVGVVTRATVPAGPHTLRVDKAGFAPAVRNVAVTAGESILVAPYLIPSPQMREVYESRARSAHTIGWGLALGGTAIAVGGVVAGLVLTARHSDAQDHYDAQVAQSAALPKGSCVEGSVCLAEFDAAAAKLSSSKTQQTVAFVVAGVGVAALGAGIWVLITADDIHRYDRPPATAKPGRLAPSFVPLRGGGFFQIDAFL